MGHDEIQSSKGGAFKTSNISQTSWCMDWGPKAKTYKEQKHLFLKTVTGDMTSYQAEKEKKNFNRIRPLVGRDFRIDRK